jgi:hypothetical protein
MLAKIYKDSLIKELNALALDIEMALKADFQPKPGRINYNFSGITLNAHSVLQRIAEYKVVNAHKV